MWVKNITALSTTINIIIFYFDEIMLLINCNFFSEEDNTKENKKIIRPDYSNLLGDSFEVWYSDKRDNISVVKDISKK